MRLTCMRQVLWLFGVMLAQVRAFGYAGVGVGRLQEVAEGCSCGLVQVLARVWRESGASLARAGTSWHELARVPELFEELDQTEPN